VDETAVAAALGLDPTHVVAGSIRLAPWASRSETSSVLTLQIVVKLSGSPDQVTHALESGQTLQLMEAGW
jgi:hypothetical protein